MSCRFKIAPVTLASFKISKKAVTVTATDASKTYGEADPGNFEYSYNLLYDEYRLNGQLSRKPGENVGVYEIGQGTLTNENNPNYDITFISGKFIIEPDKSGIEGLTIDNVKSTDKEDLAQLKDDVQALIDSGNTTENEKTALEEMIKDIEGLEDKIEEIETQLERIAGIENIYNPETVTSDDKVAIQKTIAEIETVNPDNLTDEQKAEYEEIKAGLEALLDEIAAAEKAVEDIGAELEMFDEESITVFREEEIEAFKEKLDELLADKNMGEAEKAKLNEYKAQADTLIEIIHTPVKYFSLRFFYFIRDCFTWKYNGIFNFFSKIFNF